MRRFALYYAPQPETALAKAAAAWLGRDHNALECSRLTPTKLTEERWKQLTAAPFHYGFHGTLKAPFRLDTTASTTQLFDMLHHFCSRQKSFTLQRMEIAWMGRFLCLRPVVRSSQLDQLAQETVQQFDLLRAQMSATELARRCNKGLTPRQDALLRQWGYPYVMEEFRFHLTLSSPLDRQTEREQIEEEAHRHFLPHLLKNIPVDGISLFIEKDGRPMQLEHFFPFTP